MPTVSVMQRKEGQEDELELLSEHEIEEGAVLFDALDAQGVTLPHGCLAGSCGSCRLEVIEGQEHLSELSAIEKDTVAHLKLSYAERYGEGFLQGKTVRLSCRTKVFGPIKITRLPK